jgi:hypothetical protein
MGDSLTAAGEVIGCGDKDSRLLLRPSGVNNLMTLRERR